MTLETLSGQSARSGKIMSRMSVMLKTIGGMMCLVSAWLLITSIPIPNPVTCVNYALLISFLTFVFTGVGLLVSAVADKEAVRE